VKPGVLTFYRIMAYVTAVLLLLLCLAMVFKYGWPTGSPTQLQGNTWVSRIGFAHGWLYMVYLGVAFLITKEIRVPIGRMLLVLLAGTVPFGAFFAERRVTRWFRHRVAGEPTEWEQAEESRTS
jgi:integral membrane protein